MQVTTRDGLGQDLVLRTVPIVRPTLVFKVTRVIQTHLQDMVTTLRLPPPAPPFVVVNPVTVVVGADPEDRLFAPEQILALSMRMPTLLLDVRMRLRLLKLTLHV